MDPCKQTKKTNNNKRDEWRHQSAITSTTRHQPEASSVFASTREHEDNITDEREMSPNRGDRRIAVHPGYVLGSIPGSVPL